MELTEKYAELRVTVVPDMKAIDKDIKNIKTS